MFGESMDKYLYLNELYDYYKELFTNKQQSYFEDYYFENLSLSEIAQNNKVSRNAVYNQLKIVEKKLYEYEEKLQLKGKKERIKELLKKNINDKLLDRIDEIL